jgi:hypothetical protein
MQDMLVYIESTELCLVAGGGDNATAPSNVHQLPHPTAPVPTECDHVVIAPHIRVHRLAGRFEGKVGKCTGDWSVTFPVRWWRWPIQGTSFRHLALLQMNKPAEVKRLWTSRGLQMARGLQVPNQCHTLDYSCNCAERSHPLSVPAGPWS